MNARSIAVKVLIALSLLIAFPRVWAQDGLRGAFSQPEVVSPFEQRIAISDFDDDKKPDGAVLLPADGVHGRRIQVHLTGRPNAELIFESTQPALTVTARDVDNDGDYDVVVEESITHKPLHVWINEGHGDFREGRIQDFPSLTVETHEQLRSPSNQTECLTVGLPPQPGFDLAILTVHLLGRPPSTCKRQAALTGFSAASRTNAPNHSRAPPILS